MVSRQLLLAWGKSFRFKLYLGGITVNEDLKNSIAELLEIEPEELTSDKILEDIQEWDSVIALSIMVLLSDELGIPITPSEMSDLETFGDIGVLLASKR